eukprot:31340-Pelagococcus_subviridis.AAC.4
MTDARGARGDVPARSRKVPGARAARRARRRMRPRGVVKVTAFSREESAACSVSREQTPAFLLSTSQ